MVIFAGLATNKCIKEMHPVSLKGSCVVPPSECS